LDISERRLNMASQTLVEPFYVKFHSNSVENPDTLKAFAFLVTKVDDGEHYSGAVWCDDQDNDAGLAPGWNERSQIGKGGPGSNVSWSPFE
jgi:hypothetical protein